MRWAIALAYLGSWVCTPATVLAQDPFFSHSYAVVVGIDRYPDAHFKQLHNAASDARAIADYLRTQKYDQVIALYNEQATKHAIMAAMQNQLAPRLRKDDRVLVFFAGHGFTETLGGKDRGYFVPYDGSTQSAGYISMDELLSAADYMGNAKHLVFIMDSCYGGMLGAETRGTLVNPNVPDYLNNIAGRITRQVLTAGGKGQEVLDGGSKGHSVFVDAILEALEDGKADRNRNGFITFNELFDYVMMRASNQYQTPLASVLPGNQGGEYLFRSPLTRVATMAPSSIEPVGRERRGAEPVAAEPPSPEPVKAEPIAGAPPVDRDARSPVVPSKVDSSLKRISVAVLSEHGRLLEEFQQGNFRVMDGGAPQTIVEFKESGPATIAILIQFNRETRAPVLASLFTYSLAPKDWISVSTYDMKAKVLCDFSQDHASISRVLNQLSSSNLNESNLFDAVSDLENRMKDVQGRKAIVVYTDGVDTFSRATLPQTVSTIKANGVPVYTIWVASARKATPTNDSVSALNALASAGGGQAFFASSEHEFQAASSTISAGVHGYEISYRPASQRERVASNVAVELVNLQTKAPLQIQDETGAQISYHIVVTELP